MPAKVTPRRLAGVLRRPLSAVMQKLSDMGVDVRDPDELLDPATVDALTNGRRPQERSREDTVFIVHGHHGLRDTVAAFVASLGLHPVVLDSRTESRTSRHREAGEAQ